MPNKLLEAIVDANPTPEYPLGDTFYYEFADSLTRQQAQVQFAADQAKLGKLTRTKRTPDPGYTRWVVDEEAPTTGTPREFVGRNVGVPASESSLTVYIDGPVGQTYRVELIATGTTAAVPQTEGRGIKTLEYNASGFTRAGLIDSTLATKYAGVMQQIPNGTYLLRWVNAQTGAVVKSWPITVTDTGPVMALTATTTANILPTVANPLPDKTVKLNEAVSFSVPTNTFTDADGTIVSVVPLSLPPGLAWNPSTQTITGTPSTLGTTVITVRGTDNLGGTVDDQFTITVVGGTVTVSVEAESGTGNGDVLSISSASGGTAVGNFGSTVNYRSYPLTLAQAGSYPVSIAYATGKGFPSVCTIEVGSLAPQTVTLPDSGGWDQFKTISVPLQLPAGSSTFTVRGVNNQYFRLDRLGLPSDSSTTPTTPADPTAFIDYTLTQRYLYWNPFLKGDSFNPTTKVFNTDEYQGTAVFKAAGANAFGPAVFWHDLEPTTAGSYDFGVIDAIGKRSKELSQPFLLRVLLHRSLSYPGVDTLIPTSERQRDQTGTIGTYQNQVAASFASTSVRTTQANMVSALIDHIASQDYAYLLLGMAFTTSPYYEGEYSQNTTTFDTFGLFDYSEPMQALWRTRMQAKYGTLSALNTAHGTSYNTAGNWSQVTIPVPANSGGYYWNFGSPSGRDLYDFRLDVLADWHNFFGSVVKAKSTKIKVICEVGSQHDPISLVRGTTGLVARCNPLYIDVMKQNADPAYDSRKQTEIGLAGGLFKGADEFCTGLYNFSTNQWVASIEANVNQATATFKAGACLMSVANAFKTGSQYGNSDWNISVDRINNTLAQIFAQTPLSQPVPTKNYDLTKTVTMNLSDAVNSGGMWNTSAWSQWNTNTIGYSVDVKFLVNDDL